LAESEDKRQKNQPQRNKNQLSSTVSLLRTLFEDLGCAIELHEKLANEVTELHSLDPRNNLFNGQEKGDDCIDYLFGQGIINEASSDNKEYLQLYESWCLFAYREFCKNLLAILNELSLGTFGEKSSIQNRFCKYFGLHDDERIHVYLMKLSNNTNSDSGFSYETVMNSQNYTIRSGITRPCQFSLGNITTMSSMKISRFFNERNNIANQQEEVPMTTSKQFEQAYIIFSTMKKLN
jgi:hypothetical protein